jgi:hypothetical protein
MFDDPRRDARHNQKFRRFVLATSFILMMLGGLVFGLAKANYDACGSFGRCPTGWDIPL